MESFFKFGPTYTTTIILLWNNDTSGMFGVQADFPEPLMMLLL